MACHRRGYVSEGLSVVSRRSSEWRVAPAERNGGGLSTYNVPATPEAKGGLSPEGAKIPYLHPIFILSSGPEMVAGMIRHSNRMLRYRTFAMFAVGCFVGRQT